MSRKRHTEPAACVVLVGLAMACSLDLTIPALGDGPQPDAGPDGHLADASPTDQTVEPVVVNERINLHRVSLDPDRRCADGGDAVAYNVVAFADSGEDATIDPAPAPGCLAPGDEVLLINLQSPKPSATDAVGRWELLEVATISGAQVRFARAKRRAYGEGSSAGFGLGAGSHRVVLQRVPAYPGLHVEPAGKLTGDPFDCRRGGVIFVRVRGELRVEGTIDLTGRGYAGGGAVGDTAGNQGDSIGGGCVGVISSAANLGGGGGGQIVDDQNPQGPGGGGGHATAGEPGSGGRGGAGGQVVGNSSELLQRLLLGSGGGGGANNKNGPSGAGGRGGGIIGLLADTIVFAGAGAIHANGEPGTPPCNTSGAGGGGAGGSLLIVADAVTKDARIEAAGGAGGPAENDSCTTKALPGGRGGTGRVQLVRELDP